MYDVAEVNVSCGVISPKSNKKMGSASAGKNSLPAVYMRSLVRASNSVFHRLGIVSIILKNVVASDISVCRCQTEIVVCLILHRNHDSLIRDSGREYERVEVVQCRRKGAYRGFNTPFG